MTIEVLLINLSESSTDAMTTVYRGQDEQVLVQSFRQKKRESWKKI